MAKYQKLCNEILESVGGKNNIAYATHCVTRLRFNLNDKSLVNPISIRVSRAEQKKLLEEKYVGKRIRLIRMAESDSPYGKAPYIREPGEEGFCYGVDDGPHLLMRWDCGSSLRLLPDVDEFEVI